MATKGSLKQDDAGNSKSEVDEPLKRKAPEPHTEEKDNNYESKPVKKSDYSYYKDFIGLVEMTEDTLRGTIEEYVKTDFSYAKSLSALYQKVKKLKQFTGRNMSESVFRTKSKKLEKLDDEMWQLFEAKGETRGMES